MSFVSIHYCRSLQAKQRETQLSWLSVLLVAPQRVQWHGGHLHNTHTHIGTCIHTLTHLHTQNKVCGWLLWCAAGIRMSCGQPCATEWPQDTQSSTALYLKCTCMIYLGPWKAGKESLRHPAILSGPEEEASNPQLSGRKKMQTSTDNWDQ